MRGVSGTLYPIDEARPKKAPGWIEHCWEFRAVAAAAAAALTLAAGIYVRRVRRITRALEIRFDEWRRQRFRKGVTSGGSSKMELKRKQTKKPFRYFDKGNMAVVGKNYAVLERGRLHTSGFLTWLLWAIVHISCRCRSFRTGCKCSASGYGHMSPASAVRV